MVIFLRLKRKDSKIYNEIHLIPKYCFQERNICNWNTQIYLGNIGSKETKWNKSNIWEIFHVKIGKMKPIETMLAQ